MRLGPSLPALATLALALPLRAQGNPAVDSAVAAALRTAAAPEIEFIAPARPLGDGRYAAVAARARAIMAAAVTVHACVAAPPAPDSAGGWRATCIPLPTPGIDRNLFAASVDTAAGWHAGDLDHDGALELLIRLGYDGVPERAVGSTGYGKGYAIELAPRMRVALVIDAGIAPGSSFAAIREGDVRLEDTNGDGHADLVLEGRTCADRDAREADRCRPIRRVWTWTAARGWVAGSAAPARRPS